MTRFVKAHIPTFFIMLGALALALGWFADRLGLGEQGGIGQRQAAVLVAGILLLALGGALALRQSLRQAAWFSALSARIQAICEQVYEKPAMLLAAAAWFGLVTGLVEGALALLLRELGLLSGLITYLGGAVEILWIAPLVNLLLFTLLGLLMLPLALRIELSSLLFYAVFVFAWLAAFNWLGLLLIGRIYIFTIGLLAFTPALAAARLFAGRRARLSRFWAASLPSLILLTLILIGGVQGGLALIEALQTAGLPPAAASAPNILVIVVDTLRADHLSSYGYPRQTSPNLDRLAQQGVSFQNAISTSSWTLPAHFSLLSGRYPFQAKDANGAPTNAYLTLGEVLQARGYRTAAFSGNYYVFSRRLGFGRGFIHFEDYYRTPGNALTSAYYGRLIESQVLQRLFKPWDKLGRYQAEDINRAALAWVDGDPQRPFFVFINYYDVHDPYLPPQPYRSRFSPLKNPGGLIDTDWDLQHSYLTLTPQQLQSEMDAYDGAIAYVDDQIAALLAGLERRGRLENTLVVALSDHGELLGEHGLIGHGNSLYRQLIHVPLIVWWPGRIPAGVRVEQPVTIAALPATILDLIGEARRAEFPNPSLAALWGEGASDKAAAACLSELEQLNWVPPQYPSAQGAMWSVFTPEWHLIEHAVFGPELYDWQQDPNELRDLAGRPDSGAVLAKLKQQTWNNNTHHETTP
jgi:arylsulfatase A-like enzyme